VFSVVEKFSHPIRLNRQVGVEVISAMPLEPPQLFKANLPDSGTIEEDAIQTSVVAVHAETSHFVLAWGIGQPKLCVRGLIDAKGPGINP